VPAEGREENTVNVEVALVSYIILKIIIYENLNNLCHLFIIYEKISFCYNFLQHKDKESLYYY
jgi:hypothetical protein